jgi:hypothetical protein
MYVPIVESATPSCAAITGAIDGMVKAAHAAAA